MKQLMKLFIQGFTATLGGALALGIGVIILDDYQSQDQSKPETISETLAPDFIEISILEDSLNKGHVKYKLQIKNNSDHVLTKTSVGIRFNIDGLQANSCTKFHYADIGANSSTVSQISCKDIDIRLAKKLQVEPFVGRVEFKI